MTFYQDLFKKLDLHLSHFIFIFGSLFFCIFADVMAYEVHFQGVTDPKALKLIQSVSQLEKLKNAPPATLTGLKRRAEGELTTLVQALHSLAYYNAKVDFAIENQGAVVAIKVDLGPIYPLAEFRIHYLQNGKEWQQQGASLVTLEELKLNLGEAALPDTILNAEENLLDQLNLKGYAFASIKKREVLVNQQEKNVKVILEVDIGPLTYFGPLKFSGLERVKEGFFYKKLRWQEGDVYDPKKVEKTQEALELSGLFRSVNIRHAEEPIGNNRVPLSIDVIEAKQRSVGFGLNYTTELGPGITAEWEDRNIFGLGQRLSLHADIWQKIQEGRLTYTIPDFRQQNQNLIWLLEYNHEKIRAFTESTFSVSATIERQLTDHLRISYGGMYKLIRSERSYPNGTFDLIKIPLQVRWSNVDSLLDPTKGGTINIKVIPSFQIFNPRFAYSINTFTGTYYQSLDHNKRHIFAAKLMLGSIIGASRFDIPPPERFLAGTENALRGYKYLTVSPLDRDDKPIGGRSLFIYSLELRNRIGKNLGWVFFYEIGNVFLNAYPNCKKKLLRSAGLGLRYHTPVGPIRLDVAVPLDRRRHIDGPFQVYFSIGQAF